MSNVLSDATLRGQTRITGTLAVPAGSFRDADIAPGAGIAADKSVHQFPLIYSQANGASVASATVPLHIARNAAVVESVQVATTGAAAIGDAEVDIDIHKGNQATAYASILTAEVTIDSAVALRQVVSGSIATAAVAAGDSLLVVVVATPGTGTLPQGLIVRVVISENP
jgi:hypothetical protein